MIISKKTVCVLFLLIFAHSVFSAEKREFKHPSIISMQENLDGLKKRIASSAITKSGYEKLAASKYVDVSRTHTPYAIVKIVGELK